MRIITVALLFTFLLRIQAQERSNKNECALTIEKSPYGLIFTTIEVNGKSAKAMIDFGDPHRLQLSSSFVANQNLKVEKTSSIAKDVFGNTFNINEGTASQIKVGNWDFNNVEFQSSPNELESVANQINTEFNAVLGWGFFKNYFLEMNYSENTITLRSDVKSKRDVFLSVDFNKNSSYLSVPVTIKNNTVNLIVDTGSSSTVIDSSFMKDNQMTDLTFKLGGQQFQPNAVIQDLSILKQLDAVGIIGGDIIGSYILHIDPFQKTLSFENKKT